MANAVNLPGERLAGLTIDLMQKLRNGVLTLDELDKFNRRCDPFGFDWNEHGHAVITFQGLDLTGFEELEGFKARKQKLDDLTVRCFTGSGPDSYDAKHRLVSAREYKIALMPAGEIGIDAYRTEERILKRGMEHHGYGKPLAGHIPRIRERISDKQMMQMGLQYIASLHDPIRDDDGQASQLAIHSKMLHSFNLPVQAALYEPTSRYNNVLGCFAFPVVD